MKKSLSHMAVVVLLFLLVCPFTAQTEEKKRAKSLEERMDEIDRLPAVRRDDTMGAYVSQMRWGGVRVNLQTIPSDSKKDPIMSGDMIVDWREAHAEFKVDLSLDTPVMLDQLVAAFPMYQWKKIGHSFVVFPKNYNVRLPKDLMIKKGSLEDALLQLRPILAKHAQASWEMHRGNGAPREWEITRRRAVGQNVDISGLLVPEALTRLCDEAGPDVVWTMWGIDERSSYIIGRLPGGQEK